MATPGHGSRRQYLIQHLSLPVLLAGPALLAVATVATLVAYANPDIAMLYSQCHAHARLTHLSRIPLLGTPACFLASFMSETLSSTRGLVVVMGVQALLAAALTATTLESARRGSRFSPAAAFFFWIATSLLLFGPAPLVWQLVAMPAMMVGTRRTLRRRERHRPGSRHVRVGIPSAVGTAVGVAVGFVGPAVAELVTRGRMAEIVLAWYFFPVWAWAVGVVVRPVWAWAQARRTGQLRLEESLPTATTGFRLDSSWVAVTGAFVVPFLFSAVAHGLLIWSLVTGPDDGREMARVTARLLFIDGIFLFATACYWLLIEAGWVMLVVVVVSVILGPGAGLSIGWIYREHRKDVEGAVKAVAVGSRRSSGGDTADE